MQPTNTIISSLINHIPKTIIPFEVEPKICSRKRHSLNSYLLALLLLGLRNHDAQDTILHGSLDIVLIDANREAERPTESANRALGNPEFLLRLLGLVFLGLGLDSDILLISLTGILNRSLGRNSLDGMAILTGVLNSLSSNLALDETSRWSALSIAAIDAALDGEGMRVGELDLDILLIDARKLAVEFVRILNLLDVEFGVEGLEVGVGGTVYGAGDLVELVEEAEDGGEGGLRVVDESAAGEERHLACGVVEGFRCLVFGE